ncbi:MAG: hypothetical protein DHS20C17_30360 [Cyclobacteriaceae bacterium]|nr:MAG: hypothetical protein DHS20C17_30360 [Cyclobacteriaceae bacterium]
MLTATDLTQLKSKGIQEDQILKQINNFQQGFPFMKLIRAASIDDGIISLSEERVNNYIDYYSNNLKGNQLVKFVPASGAASRMFKEFFALMQNPTEVDSCAAAVSALRNIERFSFYQELKQKMSDDGLDLINELEQSNFRVVLEYILTDRGLNYGFLPKGLLAFHQYGSECRTPVEEHLVEAANYGKSEDGIARLHFTVSPQHQQYFDELEQKVKASYQREFNVSYQISYSAQKPSTDTIAVDLENKPFRNDDGSILFRPGGHGALLENLDEIDGDLVFIKNIDNVVPDHLKSETYRYKKALGGLLLTIKNELFRLLERLDSNDPGASEEAARFLSDTLSVKPPQGTEITNEYLHSKLNRPIRVCGMVKNLGEPGGGPFWTTSPDGSTALQIVETSQVDPDDPTQQEIVKTATHFNPVDLVCSTRDYQGNKFDLLKYRDPNTGFISKKSKDGKELKALELPGLWNGSMSDWNTIFVQVPVETFNPVKTVNDLLRPEHQPES